MKKSLVINGLVKFFIGMILIGACLFLPAGSFLYWNAWLFMAVLFGPMLVLGVYLFIRSPDLLAKRLKGREVEKEQNAVVKISGLLFIIGFILAGVDYRFGWSAVSKPVVVCAAIVLLISYALYAEVMRENAFLSRTVEVQDGQCVVDTGLYGVVRHPMYSTTLILFLSFALVLGSLLTFVCFLGFIPLFVFRIKNEEKVLLKGLKGYEEYCRKVRYRLIPMIW